MHWWRCKKPLTICFVNRSKRIEETAFLWLIGADKVPATKHLIDHSLIPLISDILLAERMHWTIEYVQGLDPLMKAAISAALSGQSKASHYTSSDDSTGGDLQSKLDQIS
jgi:hypothetical protein